MPSSGKTEILGLNRFVGADKPKMDDVNHDNNQLEKLVGGHIQNASLHLTQSEKDGLGKSHFEIFTYIGDDMPERTITLPFAPTFGIVYANEHPMVSPISGAQCIDLIAGYISQEGCTQAYDLNGRELHLTQDNTIPNALTCYRPNVPNAKYICVLFR